MELREDERAALVQVILLHWQGKIRSSLEPGPAVTIS
jgi:hypothetical protein